MKIVSEVPMLCFNEMLPLLFFAGILFDSLIFLASQSFEWSSAILRVLVQNEIPAKQQSKHFNLFET